MTNVLYNNPDYYIYTLHLTVDMTLFIFFGAIPSLLLVLYPMKWSRKILEDCCSNRYMTGVTFHQHISRSI